MNPMMRYDSLAYEFGASLLITSRMTVRSQSKRRRNANKVRVERSMAFVAPRKSSTGIRGKPYNCPTLHYPDSGDRTETLVGMSLCLCGTLCFAVHIGLFQISGSRRLGASV